MSLADAEQSAPILVNRAARQVTSFDRLIIWIIGLFLAAGVITVFVKAPPKGISSSGVASIAPLWFLTGLHGVTSPRVLVTIAGYFAVAGSFVFGSGLAIVPFLHGGVVTQYHWLNEQQFLDAVAVAMITPGPVVITDEVNHRLDRAVAASKALRG